MPDIYDLKKMKWFEELTYRLFKNVNHSDFHEERELKLNRHKSINAAVIKIFAYRLTYENFEMLRDRIVQAAREIASEEMEALKKLNAKEENQHYPVSDASNLIKIILLLLHEEASRHMLEDEELDLYLEEDKGISESDEIGELCLDEIEGKLADQDDEIDEIDEIEELLTEQDEASDKQPDEKERKEKSDPRWATSSSTDRLTFRGDLLDDLAKNLAEYEKKKTTTSAGKLKDRESDDFFDEKKDSKTEDENAADLKEVETEVDKSIDDLILNLGDKGLDDLIFGKKNPQDVPEDNEDEWMGWVD
ncbi:hypothetical protein QUF72_14370 [Desulfobacterales bacterium HSG2]|nr:hypothetical protein [Desulfobacterales bacterium HSG2]